MNNAKSFKDNSYVIIPKILSGELLDFIGIYAYNRARIEGINPADWLVPNTPGFVNDYTMENLSDFLLPKIESAVGMKLLSTYTYFRVYKAGDILEKHIDRSACEISISLCLRKKGNIWPIYANNTDYKKEHNLGEGCTTRIMLEEGDMMIYRGHELVHWREPYTEGTKLAQAFLHYVDANGPHTEWKNDKGSNKYFAQYK